MQVLRMVRVVYQEWLRHAICNMEPWLSHSRFCFLQTLFLMLGQVFKNGNLLSYFLDSGKRNVFIRKPSSSIFYVRESCQRPPPPCIINDPAKSAIFSILFMTWHISWMNEWMRICIPHISHIVSRRFTILIEWDRTSACKGISSHLPVLTRRPN